MKNAFSILILALVFTACKNETKETIKTYAQLENANWLIGEWGNTTKDGVLTETWTKETDSTMIGKTVFVAGKDTVFTENITLEQRQNDLYYIPTVKDQNNGKPVLFKLTTSTDKLLVFENPKHDFPNKITYTQVTKDSLVAEISGTQKGKEAKEAFSMKRK